MDTPYCYLDYAFNLYRYQPCILSGNLTDSYTLKVYPVVSSLSLMDFLWTFEMKIQRICIYCCCNASVKIITSKKLFLSGLYVVSSLCECSLIGKPTPNFLSISSKVWQITSYDLGCIALLNKQKSSKVYQGMMLE